MIRLALLGSILFSILFISCEKGEEVISGDPSLRLQFSSDTVFFDTLFTAKRSITQRLRVFNRNDKAVNIEEISLESGQGSAFTLFVNGIEGNSFQNVILNGEDSLLILVEALIDSMDQDMPFIVEDHIQFSTNGNLQEVLLLAYGQDAVRFSNQVIPCNTTWTADRPYLISDTVLVDEFCTLTIEAGSRIFFEPDAIFFVAGQLVVEGAQGDSVVFTNSRRDFAGIPGQWRGIFFLEGSTDNQVDYALIENGRIGLRLGTPDDDDIPDLTLSNTVIRNMSLSGLLAFNSDVYAYNTLIYNCADFTVGNLTGGTYRYEHCTFASFNFEFFRTDPSVVFADNIVLPDNSLLVNDLKVTMTNSIVWGGLSEELIFSESSGQNELSFDYNLLRTEILSLDTGNNILNQDPLFINPLEENYRVPMESPVVDQGSALGIFRDLDGNDRDANPDLGAYEYIPD